MHIKEHADAACATLNVCLGPTTAQVSPPKLHSETLNPSPTSVSRPLRPR